jgi:xylitol oxidase
MMPNPVQHGGRRNWAGNYSYSAAAVHEPSCAEEVQELVRNSAGPLKALGSQHSFNDIADTTGTHISLSRLNSVEIDPATNTVTVGSGVRYGELVPLLHEGGLALHNLASLPHISVAGAIATATHGSGLHCGNLATAVSGLETVTGTGEIVRLAKSADRRFEGAVVSLGALGIVTRITLRVEPAYDVAQTVYLDLPFSVLEDHLEEIFLSGYSVSLFTDWQNNHATQVWIKQRADHTQSPGQGAEFFAARRASANVHPIAGHEAEACTEQLGCLGPWYARLPHFRVDHTPSSGQELQSEYFVPLENGFEAIRAVEGLRDAITPLLYVTELRTVAADNLWMSMAYQQRSLAIHFTWKPDWAAVRDILPQIEQRLEPFGARPHWGKLFTMSPDRLARLYSRITDFRSLVAEFDPQGRFRNEFLRQYIEP